MREASALVYELLGVVTWRGSAELTDWPADNRRLADIAAIAGGAGGGGTTGEPMGVAWGLVILERKMFSIGLVSMSPSSG